MSTRITKEIAKDVAIILCKEKYKIVEKSLLVLSEYIEKLRKDNMPTLILQGFQKFPEYFNRSQSIYIRGEGIKSYESQYSVNRLPKKDDGLQLSKSESAKYISLKNNVTDTKLEYDKLLLDVQTAIQNARTYNKIAELFPEAVPYLPKKYPFPAINYSDIRNRLKK